MTENKGTTELHSKTGGCKAEKCSFMGNRSCVDVLGGGRGAPRMQLDLDSRSHVKRTST